MEKANSFFFVKMHYILIYAYNSEIELFFCIHILVHLLIVNIYLFESFKFIFLINGICILTL